jgi:hypothetical protein
MPAAASGQRPALPRLSHHFRQFDVMGAHPDRPGVRFTVWAPNARTVGVVGGFHGWHFEPLQRIDEGSGLWHGRIESARAGGGMGNLGRIEADGTPLHGHPASATLTLPPLATLVLVDTDPSASVPGGVPHARP